jgi:hypothetical protein
MARTLDLRTAPQGREEVEVTREMEDRETHYRPPSNLPDPAPRDGYEFRWIRTDMLGKSDNRNVSMRYREGWEPCRADDHPEMQITSDRDTEYEDNIVIGGLMLCACTTELMEKRNAYYRNVAQAQVTSVDHNFMRESDPRMPLLETEHTSRVEFGAGRRR